MSIAIRDNLSGGVSRCQQITGFTVTVGFSTAGTIKASWTNPTDSKYKGVRIMYKTGGYPTSPTDGSVFYDSNDATPVSTFTKSGFTDGTLYYLRAFAYTYKNATRLYTTTTTGAQANSTPVQVKGQQIFTSSGNFTVPAGVTAIDVFLVGGGGGSGIEYNNGWGGAGGGNTHTSKKFSVTPGSVASVLIGAGGIATDGSATTFTIGSTTLTAKGGKIGSGGGSGSGGSGGGGGIQYGGTAGNGGSDGSNGKDSISSSGSVSKSGGAGQGTTTRAFEESSGTLYAGGGGGAWSPTGYTGSRGLGGAGGGGNGQEHFSTTNIATGGTANTGGGAGGHYASTGNGSGGSGIAIVRWGY